MIVIPLALAAAMPVAAAHPGAAPAAPPAGPSHALPKIAVPVRHHWPTPSPASRVANANARSTLEPSGAGYLNAVQVYPYAEGMIYRVFAAPERVTDIALQPGETLGTIAAGDTVRWVIGDTSSGAGETKRTHILIKPFEPGLATNLLVTTDRRTYHLSLVSTGTTAMAALSWTYPQDALIAWKRAAAEAQAAAPVARGLALEQLRFDYSISGDTPPWRPLRAFDDGRQTFIEFPATLGVGEAPPLFVLGAKGEAELVNYRVNGRFYIVDRLFGAAELRLGTKHQDIVRITRVAPANHDGRRAS
jgi:type IV secretion system protein VirB9